MSFREFLGNYHDKNYLAPSIIPRGQGKYSDEYAFVIIWNYAVQNNYSTRYQLQTELDKSRTDKTHALNINNADSTGFIGGRQATSHQAYYSELTRAIEVFLIVSRTPQFQAELSRNIPAIIISNTRQPSPGWLRRWRRYGGKDKTPKTDIVIGNKKISYKKGGGSQLMSGQGDEFISTYYHASREALKYGHLDHTQRKTLRNKVKKIYSFLQEMKMNLDTNAQQKAQKLLNEIHGEYPELLNHVYHEAATGAGKFGRDSELSANYIITSSAHGEKTRIINLYEDNLAEINNNILPRVAKSKGGAGVRPGNVKIDLR